MSRIRSWMSKHPGRISLKLVGSTPYSSGGRPATAFRPTLVASWPSNTHASVPSGLVITFGAWSLYLSGMCPANMSGGSTTWSSTDTRIRSSIFMVYSLRALGPDELAPVLFMRPAGASEEQSPGRRPEGFCINELVVRPTQQLNP